MSPQAQTSQVGEKIIPFSNDAPSQANSGSDVDEKANKDEQQYRASSYSILAALLRSIPAPEVLEHVAEFSKVEVDEDELLLSMSTLGLAAGSSESSAINDEYHELFIGLGRGELVPYGSWYLTGYLMEQPLSILRDDLTALGFERDESVVEPEDHVAALCEVMSLMISNGADTTNQAHFFEKHISSWITRFFDDLSEAKSAVFYRAVGRFGTAFINLEKQYLTMPV